MVDLMASAVVYVMSPRTQASTRMSEAVVSEKDPAPAPAARWTVLLKLLRPKQWTKNLIAYAPLLFAIKIHEGNLFLIATLCVVALCLVSGGVYILNDVLDVEADRLHPKKKLRPIASGQVKIPTAIAIGVVAVALGLAISFLIRPTLCLVVLVFLGLNLLYTTVLKHYAIVDVFSIAANFVLRAVAGAIAVYVPVSGWFLLCTTLGALFLALEKRRQELDLLGDDSLAHRKSLGIYSPDLLDRMEALVVASLLTSYAFYSFLSVHGHWMMLTVPFVIYGIMRYQLLSVEHKLTGAPEEVLLKDRPIQITVIAWVVTCALVVYGAPKVLKPISQALDSLQVFKLH